MITQKASCGSQNTSLFPLRQGPVTRSQSKKRKRVRFNLPDGSPIQSKRIFVPQPLPSCQDLFNRLEAYCAETKGGAIEKLHTRFKDTIKALYSIKVLSEREQHLLKLNLNYCFKQQERLSPKLTDIPLSNSELVKYLCTEIKIAYYFCWGSLYYKTNQPELAFKQYSIAIEYAKRYKKEMYPEACFSIILCLGRLKKLSDIGKFLKIMHEDGVILKCPSYSYFYIAQCCGSFINDDTKAEIYIGECTALWMQLRKESVEEADNKEIMTVLLPLFERFTANEIRKFKSADQLSCRLYCFYNFLGNHEKAVSYLENIKGKENLLQVMREFLGLPGNQKPENIAPDEAHPKASAPEDNPSPVPKISIKEATPPSTDSDGIMTAVVPCSPFSPVSDEEMELPKEAPIDVWFN